VSRPEFTPEQQNAINARGGTILVSAAAGSGKTAVLVERVTSLLTDPDHPIDADRLVVVTFTKAAAAEMRERIDKRISELLKEQPDNVVLRRQKMLLQHIEHIQTFLTCTGMDGLIEHNFPMNKIFHIVEGRIKESKWQTNQQQ